MAPPQPAPFSTVAVIGAGPAGLTAAYLLSKEGIRTRVLETDPELVGGIARTVRYRGYHFDIGGHRLFSKSREVEDLWTELLPDDMVDRRQDRRGPLEGHQDAGRHVPLSSSGARHAEGEVCRAGARAGR